MSKTPIMFHIASNKEVESIRDLSPILCDQNGALQVVDYSALAHTALIDRITFGAKTGTYLFPTSELVAALQRAVNGKSALEIGAGSGLLAKAVGIKATDNKMQDWPEIQQIYRDIGQKTAPYGNNVEELDAVAAVLKYRPQVVIASWVTHKYDPRRHEAGGNQYGVTEEDVVDNCETYIFIGNTDVHANKSLWARPHTLIHPRWLCSRAYNGSKDFIAIWGHNQHATKALLMPESA